MAYGAQQVVEDNNWMASEKDIYANKEFLSRWENIELLHKYLCYRQEIS